VADGDRAADAPREGHGLGRPDADERDEREHVEGAEARVDTPMATHVDDLHDARREGERRRPDGVRGAEDREDRALVVGVRVDVRERRARDPPRWPRRMPRARRDRAPR